MSESRKTLNRGLTRSLYRAVRITGRAALAFLYVGTFTAPTNASACHARPVELLSSHDFQVDLPAESGFQLPSHPTVIAVLVGTTGTAKYATIFRSSGDVRADRIALRMAKRARYIPASKNCHPVSATYFYTEDWKRDAK